MKKAMKAGIRMPAKNARESSAKLKPGVRGQAELLPIIERLAQSAERLAKAAEQLAEAARASAIARAARQPDEGKGVGEGAVALIIDDREGDA
jgi:hypothetical protein